MPIRVQYGPAGLGLRAAQQAGEGEDFWRRHAAEQQMVESVLADRRANRQLDLQNRRMELENLKQMQRQRLAASPTSHRRQPRLTGMERRQQAAAGAGFDQETRQQLEAAYQYGDRSTVNELFQRVAAPGPATGDTADPAATQKLNYVQQIGQTLNLPDEAKATLAAFAQSPDIDLNDLRLQAAQLHDATRRQQGGLSPREQAQYQLYNLRDQTETLRSEAQRLAKELQDEGVDPQGPPSQLVEQGAQAPQGPIGRGIRNYASAVDSASFGLTDFAREPEEFGLQQHPASEKYRRLQQVLQQLEQLEQQQRQMLGTEQQGQQQQPQQGGTGQGWSIQRVE